MRPFISTRLIARDLQPSRQIRSYNGDIVRKPRDSLEELLQSSRQPNLPLQLTSPQERMQQRTPNNMNIP